MKRSSVLISLLLAAALLSSCAGTPSVYTPSDDDAGSDSVDLTLWTFPVGNWGNPTAVANILSGFHKEYPNIHISTTYLNYDTGDEQVKQAVAEGNAPDLILEGPERLVANWGAQGWMTDVSDLWQSEKAAEIYQPIREACRNRGGIYYEFPLCMSAHCMAINYDLFRAAGALQYIDEETHTWTTEGFIKAVHTLEGYGVKSAGIVYCKNQSGDQGTRALVNNLYGGTFTNFNHTLYTVDSEQNRRALELLYNLDGIKFEPSLSSGDAIDLFCKGETAMCFCWNASMEIQQTINNPNLDFEVFPMAFPNDESVPKLVSGIWGLGVFDNGSEERVEAAKTFIRYLTENDAVYTKAVIATSYWPARKMNNIYENDMLMTEYSIFLPYIGDYYQITPGWSDARTAWWQMLAAVGSGKDAASALRGFPSPN